MTVGKKMIYCNPVKIKTVRQDYRHRGFFVREMRKL